MATKEEALEDFLKCFRIALNFILLYSKDHKSFLKSIADLQEKTAALLVFLNPIEIHFSAEAISIEGVVYAKMSLHRELAGLFHQRKIQSLMIRSGITAEELAILLEKLSFAPKDIIKSGGLAEILSGILQNPHFAVVDLDYSQLLRGEGEEVKDIWLFMLHNAVAREDVKKLAEFADNFEEMLRKCKARDLIDNKELNHDLHKFLEYLKKNSPEKFASSSRAILKFILKDKSVLMDDEKIKKLKVFLVELGTEDYSQVLLNEIVSDSNFDVSSFQFFSKLLGKNDHEKVADSFFKNLSGNNGRDLTANASRKVKELFSRSDGESSVSQVYLKAMLSAGLSPVVPAGIVFDRKQVSVNYCYILLNLLSEEKDTRQLEIIVDKLFKEWDKVAEEGDPEYLKRLGEVIRKRTPDIKIGLFLELRKKFYNFVESFIWEEPIPSWLADFLDTMEESSLPVDVYFKKMFDESRLNSGNLKAFFRFFPDKLSDFYGRLKSRSGDVDFLAKTVEAIKEIDPELSLPVLETLFSFSNDIIKIEILRSMAGTGKYNREFVFEVLKGSGNFLKKEALAVFSQQQDHQKAMESLFLIPNPWGKNNGILEENLAIVDELKYKQAVQYLEYLYRQTAFWNFGLKKKIKEVLGRLNV